MSVIKTIDSQEIKQLRTARRGLVKDFRALGARLAANIDFFASGLPDEEALYELWRHVQKLPRGRGLGHAAACDALNEVIIARNKYDQEVRSQPLRHIRLARDLAAFARKQTTHQITALLDRRAADLQRGPSVLVALWNGAKAARLAKDTNTEGKPIITVKIKGKWERLCRDSEEGLRSLARDPAGFAAAAQRALDSAHKNSRHDWLRPLRDLKNHPTRRRFETLLKNGARNDDSDLKIYFSILRRAAGRLFGGNLPRTWQKQIAADEKKIKAVAELALQLLKAHPTAPGPPRDAAQDAYEKSLCEIYQVHTGKVVSYRTSWPGSKSRREGSRSGPALTFVRLGLRLVDPGASKHQARACIDRYRKHKTRSRRDPRA
jgi:hypothetical protein